MSDDVISSQENATNEESVESGLNSQVENSQDENSENEQENKEQKAEQKSEQEQQEENELVGKPDNYTTDEIKLPEGMELDEEVMKEFTDFADKTNLSQKGYNKAIEYGIQLNIFESYEEEKTNKNGEIVIDELNNKYGVNMILKASSLLEDSTIRMRNRKIGGHNA